jgi:hypothetical protein
MTFSIFMTNDGDDGTIEVFEQLSANERIRVFKQIVAHGERVEITAQGTPRKDFDWLHYATNLKDGPLSLGSGDSFSVRS